MTTHLPIISISFHKNNGNRRGKLLRPVWHLLASSRNPLPPCGRLWQFRWQLRLPLPQIELAVSPDLSDRHQTHMKYVLLN
ncbi:hypothetical protein AMECASPLE_029439 [Ameca splendens]|uniref:Uncharacterized protein n=1 Tax=Ameca splendens TaxID=208324 RepID=A0ABV0YHU5_9TELE